MTSEYQFKPNPSDNPDMSANNQDMTAQYDRLLQSPRGGTYDFTLQAHDLARVLVNGTLLLDNHDAMTSGHLTK